MIAHQRQIRDAQRDDHPVPSDFSAAEVREVTFSEAKEVILKYEWLGNMGATERAFGLFFDNELAGCACFGKTAGTNVSSVCGVGHAHRVKTLCRGACAHWAHPHSASYLISRACRLMAEEGTDIFVAYSDLAAGEIGTVYQASNWLYCGMTSTNSGGSMKGSVVQTPRGRVLDERHISNLSRVRSTGNKRFFRKTTRAEMRAKMLAAGYTFTERTAKHRYVGIYATGKLRAELISALRWPVLPYPKRATDSDTIQTGTA